ncbi:MAG: VWA domain-containing protein [Saprospiraceae bacterium]|nr:VWA domain-containing protein [Saprospiraceae bacterium]
MKTLFTVAVFIYCFLPGFISMSDTSIQDQPTPIIFIYDASGSMWGEMQGKTKVEIARDVLSETIDRFSESQRIGLVAYGHRKEGDCQDVEYLVEASNKSHELVKNHIAKINPLGRTPLAYSATKVIEKLQPGGEKATVILITDGIESCGGDLCSVIQEARAAGIDFRLHVIGFGLTDENLGPLKCAAQAANGKYYDAGNAAEFSSVLEEATAQTIDVSDYNLAVYTTKNGAPIDSWVKVLKTGTEFETGGTRTYRDTGFAAIDPGIYDLLIQPLENSDVAAQMIREVEVGKEKLTFRSVSFDAGQIMVRTLMNGENWDATVNITLANESRSASGGRTYGRDQFYDVSPGLYNIELKCLKINGAQTQKVINGIEVTSGDTTRIEYNFQTGIARIGVLGQNGLMDATINIIDKSTMQSVGGGRTYTSESSNPKEFLLTPGSYSVTLVGVREFKGEKKTFDMKIDPGGTLEKSIQF